MITIEKFANKLSHHDLVFIENVLRSYRITLLKQYQSLSDELDSLHSTAFVVDDSVIDICHSLCLLYDDILYVDKILSFYRDVRKSDFENRDYRL